MARNDLIEVPTINLLHTLIEARAILSRSPIPDKSPLAHRVSLGVVQHRPDLREDASSGINVSLGVLFRRWEVEDQVSFDQGLGWFVVEDKFLVEMAVN